MVQHRLWCFNPKGNGIGDVLILLSPCTLPFFLAESCEEVEKEDVAPGCVSCVLWCLVDRIVFWSRGVVAELEARREIPKALASADLTDRQVMVDLVRMESQSNVERMNVSLDLMSMIIVS